MNRKAHVAYNFNCKFETEGLLKVKGSHIHGKSGNISETVQDRCVVITDHYRKWYVTYRIAVVPVTLSDFQGHSPIACLFKCDFSYSRAAVSCRWNDLSRCTVYKVYDVGVVVVASQSCWQQYTTINIAAVVLCNATGWATFTCSNSKLSTRWQCTEVWSSYLHCGRGQLARVVNRMYDNALGSCVNRDDTLISAREHRTLFASTVDWPQWTHHAAERLRRELTTNFRRCPSEINYYNLTAYNIQACDNAIVSSAALPAAKITPICHCSKAFSSAVWQFGIFGGDIWNFPHCVAFYTVFGPFLHFQFYFRFFNSILVPKFDNDNEIHLNKHLHCRFPTRLSDWGLLDFYRIFWLLW